MPSSTRKNAISGRLQGLRLAVKDLFHIGGLATTAGNPDWARTHPIPKCSSPVVQKLLDEGTKFVGKTITDELAYSLNGQNTHYGTPLNVKCPERIPGGSSSGSAAAVAAALADIGLGTDTGGSIRVPASYNGLYGLRPTHGVISTDNMVALAPSFDTVGWMTRDLDTLKQVAEVLFEEGLFEQSELEQHLSNSLSLLYLSALSQACEHGSALQAQVTRIAKAHDLDIEYDHANIDAELLAKASDAFRVLQGYEIWQTHGDWITDSKPNIAADIKLRLDWCQQISSDQVVTARAAQAEIQRTIANLLSQYDLLALPTAPGPAPLLNTDADTMAAYRNTLLGMTAIAGLCGLPQLNLPCSDSFCASFDGAPVGLSIIGAKGSDLQLLAIAQKYFAVI